VVGAALATLIARVLETIILLIVVYSKEGPLRSTIKELFHFDLAYVKRAYQTILPVILNDIFWGLASLVYIAVYGRLGTQAVAAIQIVNTVNNLFMVVAFGLSSAAAVLIGNSIGAGREDLVHAYTRKLMITSVEVSLIMGVFLAVTSPLILNFFEVSAMVRDSAQAILYMISIIFFIRVLGIMLVVGILRGAGDASRALLIETITMWLVGVPMILLGAFVLKLPVHYVYALAISEEIVKVALSLARLRSGKWIRNLT
jgi:Na+-driven multidrug efflux pump